jgi:hypothetical protein
LIAARGFLQLAMSAVEMPPRVINFDGHSPGIRAARSSAISTKGRL